ncbi:MAG: hypothetical protein IJ648_06785 [Lachnospiraceae bacterium]|nr:hypothetical protein [Lachnospiraceae bacterium]
MIINAILTLGCALLYVLFGTWIHLFLAVVCLTLEILEIILMVRKVRVKLKAGYILRLIGAVLFVLFVGSFASPYHKVGIYEYKLQYVDRHGYDIDHFPASVPAGAELIDMEYIPSIMQGDGCVRAYFQLHKKEQLDDLEEAAARRAEIVIPADKYVNGEFSEGQYALAKKKLEQGTGFSDMDPEIWIWKSDRVMDHYADHDITIYIVESNYYFHRLHTDSVVVDHTDGVIEYVGM